MRQRISFASLTPLWEEGDLVFCQASLTDESGGQRDSLAVVPAADDPAQATLARLNHEYGLRHHLDDEWALRPIRFVNERMRTALFLESSEGAPLTRFLRRPLELRQFLRLAVALASALGQMHRCGLVHKDLKPSNMLIERAGERVRFTGFGLATQLLRERRAPEPPELIAGTLAYMAPEQTGRMNRSIDSRSDLYSLGVVLYEMATGELPFTASEPMEWVHCHTARVPKPPCERSANVPSAVSAIIMRLLAKNAEHRYQTASGLEHDLRVCLGLCEAGECIAEFPLGKYDTPDRLLVPEKLYGREHEIEALLGAFQRCVEGGAPEFVLVAGYSGIGKSAVVGELHRVLVPRRGWFAAGKYDKNKRDIPYSTLAQAFQTLVRMLLGKSDSELAAFRAELREALGQDGQLMIDLVPELRLVVGDQAPVAPLPPQDERRRFQQVFRRFLGVFARPEHPLALFLDDLQWLDAATLDLLHDIVTDSELTHLLLVGAYRDNEVRHDHPLSHALEVMRRAGARVRQIVLGPLSRQDAARLIADALHSELERVLPLAGLILEKTGSNPFFVIQFLTALVEEGLVVFDHAQARWSWDLARIEAKGYTDNVADLMVTKLRRLSDDTQRALQELACLGNGAQSGVLALIHGTSQEALGTDLLEALKAELLVESAGTYRFVHDRVQEAAYSTIPEKLRPERHLRIGRLLHAELQAEQREDSIFEIANQLNRGATLVTANEERIELAEVNLAAGRRAKASAAYSSALAYLSSGARLLDREDQERFRLRFDLEFQLAECEILTGSHLLAEERLARLATEAQALVDRAAVACLRADLYTNLDLAERAVETALEFLRSVGIVWSAHPSDAEVSEEFERIGRTLGDRSIESLIDLPPVEDAHCRAILDVLTSMQGPAHFVDGNLVSLLIARMANISLEHGNAAGSCFAYVYLGMIFQSRFGDYARGLRFGELGVALSDKPEFGRFRARVYNNFGMAISPWAHHVRTAVALLRHANEAARAAGDLTFMGYSYTNLISGLLIAGESLVEVEAQAEAALAFLRRAHFGTAVDMVLPQLGLIRALRGLTERVATFNYHDFAEAEFERHLVEDPGLAMPACWYWIRRMQACYLEGRIESAAAAAMQAGKFLWTSPTFIVMADYHFYAALVCAAQLEGASADERATIFTSLAVHRRMLTVWADTCPDTFTNRRALAEAEIARVEGRPLEAMDLYERAIASAREQGFLHNEALANELAANFYSRRGFDKIALTYARDARRGYRQWGADAKVRQLHRRYPHIEQDSAAAAPTSTIATSVEQLDLRTVLKVSQTISAEIELERLLDTLLRATIEHAGAERAVLILSGETDQRVVAEGVTQGEAVLVRVLEASMSESALPETLCRYVLNTAETVVLDDAAAPNAFAAEPYFTARVRSVVCLPLSNRARLIGLLYLENNLAPGVFLPARLAMLKHLASQAAISLENTRLYRDLALRESKIRRLVEANIIGIFIWELDGRILEANDLFLQMLGYTREDLAHGRLHWTALTPPEWLALDEGRYVPELQQSGTVQPYEKEFWRKDGNRVPVLIGVAGFEGSSTQGVAYVLDLSERKRAQEALHRAAADLAHVSRVMALNALTASIAHEIMQPLAGIITNATTCQMMLEGKPPNIDGARETTRRTLRDGKRAAEVIQRLRALFSKRKFTSEEVDLNDAIREVIAICENQLQGSKIILCAELDHSLPLVVGDRIYLQQIVLNLVRNAIDAMADVSARPRHLLLRTETGENDSVRLIVKDAGVGLPEQDRESMFEAFQTSKSHGMGIGLFICRSIAELHQGRLWAAPNDGPGATFTLSIPREPR